MRGYLAIVLVIMAIWFLMPMLLRIALFVFMVIYAIRVIGLFEWPRFLGFGSYVRRRKREKRSQNTTFVTGKDEPEYRGGWYGSAQEGPEIILPESALRKEKNEHDSSKNV